MVAILSGMRIALFGDIHGNLPALQAVIDDLEETRPDRLICLGDIVDGFGESRACVDLVREIDPAITVLGNAEWRVREWPRSIETMRPEAVPIFGHMMDRFDDASRQFLCELPIASSFNIGDSGPPALLAFHGQPDEPFAGIRLPKAEWPASWAQKNLAFMDLDDARAPRALAPLIDDPATRWLVCGHTHVRMFRRWESTIDHGLTIVNPGTIAFGDYFNGGRLDTQYALLDADAAEGWRVTWRTLDYDKRAAAESLLRQPVVTPFMARVGAQLRAEHGTS